MKKIILTLFCSVLTLPAFASDLTNYIYGKAMLGDVDGLRSLVSEGYSLEEKDEEGNTAYCLAVFRRNQTAVQTLEMAGANIKPWCLRTVSVVTESMIYEAAHNKDVKQISLWQEYGVPVDLINSSDGNTALCQAVYEKDCPAIDVLLKAGASEYHTCMRRVPQEVRQELDCRPVIIDWERIGLTVLGAGLVAGGVAVALSGGGSSGESCSINQHWDGEKCVTCPGMQCWDGNACRVALKGEFIDPVTNRCFQIAPPPYVEGTYQPSDFETSEYHAGKFLEAINASSAYARGYTGYGITRLSNTDGPLSYFGPLQNGQSSEPGQAQDITSRRAVVGVLSTGTEIANTPQKDAEGNIEKDTSGYTIYERFVNKDLAVENPTLNEETGEVIKNTRDQIVGNGTWSGNLATNSLGSLFGFNFDYGYFSQNKLQDDEERDIERTDYYTSGKKADFLTDYDDDDDDTTFLVLHGGDCRASSGYCGIATAGGGSSLPDRLVDLEDCDDDTVCIGASSTTLTDYMYSNDYVYTYSDPAPHYSINDDDDPSVEFRSENQGTMLAGIIAALKNDKGMHGVAYNATVIPAIADIFRPITYNSIKTLVDSGANIILQDVILSSNSNPSTSASYVNSTKTMADVYGDNVAEAYNYLVDRGTIFVVGTGTYGKNTISSGKVEWEGGVAPYQKEATVYAGAPLASDGLELSKLFLSVAAVQENSAANAYGGYTLTSYSQPCGSTASYCLSAPGGTKTSEGNLYSTVSTTSSHPDYNWGYDYGTSAAAAVVAGSIAVLKGAYPHLSNQEIVSLLKQTATPLGACAGGTSSIDTCTRVTDSSGNVIGKYSTLYGWGLVNLEAATNPVGALWVHNGNSMEIKPYIGVYSILTSGLSTSSVMSRTMMNALPTTFTAFDSFNRPFAINTSSFVSAHSVRKEFDDDFKAFMHGRDVQKIEANDQFSMTYAPRTSDRSSQMKTGLMEMNVDFDKSNFNFYYTEDTLNSKGNYFERPLNNPFVQIQEAYGAEAKYNLTSKLSVGVNFATGKNGFLGDGDKHYEAPENRVSMMSTDTTYQATKSLMFKASYGVMKEQDSVLGMLGTGAFKTAGADTTFVSAGVEIKPTDKFKLNLAYTYGWTTPNQTNGLMNLSHMTADGFAAIAQYDLGSENMLGLSVSSPLRVRSGQVAFNLPVGRSATDDTIYRETFTGSMKPTAREFDFTLFYRDALSEALTLQSELGVRLNPDHQKEASPDYRAMFGLKWDY